MPVPAGVVTVIRPEVAPAGTVVPRVVAVTSVTGARRLVAPSRSRVRPGPVSKFVPVRLSAVPQTAMPGLKLVIVGTAAVACTDTDAAEVAEPVGVVTTTGPVVVLPPRQTTSSVAVAL